jgi:hypothetical protein
VKTLSLAALMLWSSAAGAAECTLTVKADVQPIFNTYCVACHQDAAPAETLSLQRASMLANTVGVKSRQSGLARIKPGDSANSYLIRKLLGTHAEAGGTGAQMPLGGVLPPVSLDVIRRWIDDCNAAG